MLLFAILFSESFILVEGFYEWITLQLPPPIMNVNEKDIICIEK